MRLTKFETTAILKAFQGIFENGDLYLFGSQVDDAQKGGDSDFYLVQKSGKYSEISKMRFHTSTMTNPKR
jgi:hypothetical protein